MRKWTFFPTLALLLLACLLMEDHVFSAENGFSADDQIRLLYSSNLTFTKDGVPEVRVGLMEGKTEIAVSLKGALSGTIYNPTFQTITALSANGLFRVRLLESKPGKAISNVILGSYSQEDKISLQKQIDEWAVQGVPTNPIRAGSIVSLNGDIINNIMYFLSAGTYSNRNEAAKQSAWIENRFSIEPYLFDQIEEPPSGTLALLDSDNIEIARSRNVLYLRSAEGLPLTVPNCEYNQGAVDAGVEARSFEGALFVAIGRDGKLVLGNQLSMEQLLMGTVPSEIFSSAPMEALKAQAIAARGQLLAELGTRHLADPYQICSSTHCQVYSGTKKTNPRTDQAVKETRGLFLVRGNKLVNTSYSASCGGHGENNDNVWFQAEDPNLRGRLDGPDNQTYRNGVTEANLDAFLNQAPESFCANAGFNQHRFRWTRSFSIEEMNDLIHRKHSIGAIQSLRPTKRGVSGRVLELEIKGEKRTVLIKSELAIRRLLDNLPSSLFKLTMTYNSMGQVQRFDFSGAGYGHGVGLCQTGAIGRAKAGQSVEQILGHYYPGGVIKKLY